MPKILSANPPKKTHATPLKNSIRVFLIHRLTLNFSAFFFSTICNFRIHIYINQNCNFYVIRFFFIKTVSKTRILHYFKSAKNKLIVLILKKNQKFVLFPCRRVPCTIYFQSAIIYARNFFLIFLDRSDQFNINNIKKKYLQSVLETF